MAIIAAVKKALWMKTSQWTWIRSRSNRSSQWQSDWSSLGEAWSLSWAVKIHRCEASFCERRDELGKSEGGKGLNWKKNLQTCWQKRCPESNSSPAWNLTLNLSSIVLFRPHIDMTLNLPLPINFSDCEQTPAGAELNFVSMQNGHREKWFSPDALLRWWQEN